MRRILYRESLKVATKLNSKSRILLASLPTQLWSRKTTSVISMDQDESTSPNFKTKADLNTYLEKTHSLDVILRQANGHSEFYLPSSNSAATPTSLPDIVRRTKKKAMQLRQQIQDNNEDHEDQLLEAFDSFFDALGFETLRRGTELSLASDLVFSTERSHLPTNPSSPFSSLQLVPSPAGKGEDDNASYKYNKQKSLQGEWKDLILITHPSACIGQEELHGSVIAMTTKKNIESDDDELLGIVLNKPWQKYYSNETEENQKTSTLRDVIKANDLFPFQQAKDDPDSQLMLDLEIFQGGPVPTSSLLLLYEDMEDITNVSEAVTEEDKDDGKKSKDKSNDIELKIKELESEIQKETVIVEQMRSDLKERDETEELKEKEFLVGTFGTMKLRVIETPGDLVTLVQQKIVDPKRCKLLTGLCVWNRDQLGIELERNVWIRTNLKDVNESSKITLIDNTQINGKDSFSENAWREAVSQLGEDYLEIATTIETNHDKMLEHLGKAAEERYERMAIVMKELGFDDDDG